MMFPDELEMRLDRIVRGSRHFRLLSFFRQVHPVYGTLTVPEGFITDGASVPRPFWPLFSPVGACFPAAVVHDWLYHNSSTKAAPLTREQADRAFYDGLTVLGMRWVARRTVFRAVRLFGWAAWKVKGLP
jgi:hypothetical protein